MLTNLLVGLICAWVITLLGWEGHVIKGMYELFGKELSMSGYYVLFGILGFISGAFYDLRSIRFIKKG